MFEAFLDYISRTNLFNFILFAGIIIYLFDKLDIMSGLEKGAKDVAQTIENSENVKTVSEEKLHTIEDKISHLENEVEEIIKTSKQNANIVGDKIISDAENMVTVISDNSKKLVENKTALLKNDIMKRASLASIEVAKKQIIEELNRNQELHTKLIDESVEAIDGVEI